MEGHYGVLYHLWLDGEIVAYKIQWFNGAWSDWFVKGINDIDWKLNELWNGIRRVWAYFKDHVHSYIDGKSNKDKQPDC